MRRKMLLTGAVLASVLLVRPPAGAAQSWRTVTMSRQVSGEHNLDVHIKYGAGRFTVRPASDDLLYRVHLRYDEDEFKPIVDYGGDRLQLGLDNLGHSIHLGDKDSGGEMEVALARSVPMDLDLEFGAVRAELDLGGMDLTGLSLSTGASKSVVDVSEPNRAGMSSASFEVGAADFTVRRLGNLNAQRIEVSTGVGSVTLGFDGQWQKDASVSISMGLGSLELRFPEGLGVSLKKDSFLTSLDSQGLVKRGDTYYSLNWDKADRKIDIDLDAAFGSVKVVWVN